MKPEMSFTISSVGFPSASVFLTFPLSTLFKKSLSKVRLTISFDAACSKITTS
jgi:hypothetical protein